MARGLARAGAAIAIAARATKRKAKPPSKTELVRLALPILFISRTSAASCRKLVESVVGDFGGCDILINNAGMNIRKAPGTNLRTGMARNFGR